MNTDNFLPIILVAQADINKADICYAVKLSAITKRRSAVPAQNKFSGIMSGLGNVITDSLSSAVTDTYLLRMNNEDVWILSDKMTPTRYRISDISKQMDFEPGAVKFSMFFSSGDIETAAHKLTPENMVVSFTGSVKSLLEDFKGENFENITDEFATVVVSKHAPGDDLYNFKPMNTRSSLISYDSDGIFLVNENRKVLFNNILAHYKSDSCCGFITLVNGEFELIEIFKIKQDISASGLNLIRNSDCDEKMDIAFPDSVLKSESFLAAFALNGLSMIASDGKLYSLKNDTIQECGIFKVESSIYVKTIDGSTAVYNDCEDIANVLKLLPFGYDNIFMDKSASQPFIYNNEIANFLIDDIGLKSDGLCFEYSKMSNFRYQADAYSCTLFFVYNGEEIALITANSLGIYISNAQEKVSVNFEIQNYTINQLYDCFYKRFSENFVASTFSEMFKTDKLMNVDCSVEELIQVLLSEESEVLRSAFKSVIGKFKNINDIQSDLIQKVTLLEIQRKKIQKIFDEWALYYPHYMASLQVQWLRFVFGENISNDILNTEYWKCIAHFKRILSGGNSYTQKSMSEIGMCINKIYAALPDEAKRADITGDLRIKSYNNSQSTLTAGTDVMVAVSGGIEIANILLKGVSATNPLALSMSAKMIVNSYTKDVELRKNIKAFGLQSLNLWQIFMRGIRIHIMELTNGINDYNKLCLKRDTELFKKIPESEKEKIKAKLSSALKNKISESINDKFMEIMPQFNIRISNIINELDSNSKFLDVTLDEFKNNLFI